MLFENIWLDQFLMGSGPIILKCLSWVDLNGFLAQFIFENMNWAVYLCTEVLLENIKLGQVLMGFRLYFLGKW